MFSHQTNYKELYNSILEDVLAWFILENKLRPVQKQFDSNGTQNNALLNFITFDLHTLITTQGFVHMQRLLQAKETDQTVMIRLKDLVTMLYVKYGTKDIDRIRKRIYDATESIYGLTFNVSDMDVNSTFWLHPFLKQSYNMIAAQ